MKKIKKNWKLVISPKKIPGKWALYHGDKKIGTVRSVSIKADPGSGCRIPIMVLELYMMDVEIVVDE